MNQRTKLSELPPSMAERAMRARTLTHANPKAVDIDDEMLPWIYDDELAMWLSFDGNYSQLSPVQKRQRAMEKAVKQKEWEDECERRIRERFEVQALWSMVRLQVLKRDNYTCQLCGDVGDTRLHIHHILKRVEGGTDHFDNLLTVCNKCHKAADGKLYDPDWSTPPRELEVLDVR